MHTVLTVIGTRPQYLKYAAIAAHAPFPFRNVLIDTGQHYDPSLSAQFMQEYAIPPPDATLDTGESEGLPRLAAMLLQLEPLIRKHRPEGLLCFGDTDSTLAAALAGARLGVPVFHVEAGARSRDMHGTRIPASSAPEEATRVTVDHLSELLLCATPEAVDNLDGELVGGDAVHTGDIMYDLFLRVHDKLPALRQLRSRYGIAAKDYALCTVHRAVNTDDSNRLRALLDTLADLPVPVYLPLHPRTDARMKQAGIAARQGSLHLLPPLPHHELLALVQGARRVLTDSGGITREAFFSGVPSICLDDATAWHMLCRSGWCAITGANPQGIHDAMRTEPGVPADTTPFGDGMAAARILAEIHDYFR
ncbi:MAG: UDP-N-acetylglucosamine 2-epimerase [Bacteroidota bacterium]|nr:UDP-N-acetylglucosamine 2-epimerase [Bacteroidota bacterium]